MSHHRIAGRRMPHRVLATLALAISMGAAHVQAQTFPNQPLKLVIPLGAGGVGDTTARLVVE